ncbi:MAG: phage portal protein [Xanthobacteraceae bacterium]|nr:phage portal protein [Xanthobacteraceae bacterium]
MGKRKHKKFETRQTSDEQAGEVRSLASPDSWLLNLFGVVPSSSGVTVSVASALTVPAVRAGTAAISETTSILPLNLYRRLDDGSREKLTDHPAFQLLNGDANEWTRGPQLRDLMTADAICYGNGFALIVKDGADQPRELHRLHPQAVSIAINAITGEPEYRYTPHSGSQARLFSFREVIHLRAPSTLSTDAVSGKSVLLEARDAIAILIVLNRYANKLFANGGRPSGILKFPNRLGDTAAAKMAASWKGATAGDNSGGTAVLEEGGEFQPLAFSSVDAQYLEIWQFAITEIARVLRVPPVLLMDYSRQTWANAETGGQQFLTYSLQPWLSRWEGVCRRGGVGARAVLQGEAGGRNRETGGRDAERIPIVALERLMILPHNLNLNSLY